jgi:CheY-like chemotaxis protein
MQKRRAMNAAERPSKAQPSEGQAHAQETVLQADPQPIGPPPDVGPDLSSLSGDGLSPGRARKKKILLVDDSMTALMMNRMLLSKCACDIVTARDGREAIEKALSERPDLVLMDVVMPQMNGFEACKELRTLEPTRHTPILLLTTRGEAESIATGFASGCTDYITKPVNSIELLAKIKTYLGD